MKKIENLEHERWAKKIYTERRWRSGWRQEVERWKDREQLRDGWNDMNCKTIKLKVQENGKQKWKEGMERKSTLKWYMRKEDPEAITWHKGDSGSKLLFKARTNTLEVNSRNRWSVLFFYLIIFEM